MARGYRVEIVKVAVIGPDGTTIEVDGKVCTKCGGEPKPLTNYGADKRKSDGRRPHCKECEHEYKLAHKERNPEYRRNYYEATADASRQYSRKWVEDNPELNKIRNSRWASQNKTKIRARDARRRTAKASLPESLSWSGWETTLEVTRRRCALTGAPSNIHMEHWLPIGVGHGGTYSGNIYPMHGTLNLSKSDDNPFEWFEANGQRFELSQSSFDVLVAKLAHQNGLTPEEFRDFTYWCFANKRTVIEVKADNLRYGYKRPSLEMWREAVGIPFPIRVDFGDLTLDRELSALGVTGSHPTEDIVLAS
ncbi:hypothetical protein [Paenibacillus sp. FSL L8-0708]|uniref:hypothetical protein n=1 Tax=Paenibacillus sp. FSL L8-0708 TaxID=2975311 RepID=UPI0030F95D50